MHQEYQIGHKWRVKLYSLSENQWTELGTGQASCQYVNFGGEDNEDALQPAVQIIDEKADERNEGQSEFVERNA